MVDIANTHTSPGEYPDELIQVMKEHRSTVDEVLETFRGQMSDQLALVYIYNLLQTNLYVMVDAMFHSGIVGNLEDESEYYNLVAKETWFCAWTAAMMTVQIIREEDPSPVSEFESRLDENAQAAAHNLSIGSGMSESDSIKAIESELDKVRNFYRRVTGK